MATIINASTSAGLIQTADTSGTLQLQSNGTTAAFVDTNANLNVSNSLNAPNTFGFKNRIINGAMVIDQRNAGASVTIPATTSQYTLDRFLVQSIGASKFSVQQNAGAVTPPAGFTNYLGITSLAATSSALGDYYALFQCIEGYNIADSGWGTANAKTVTLSFWVYSSLTGTFSGALKNYANNRSYPFTYSISAANTWTNISVTIAGDTTGTWGTTSGVGIYLVFNLGCGSTYLGTANSWQANNLYGTTGSTSVVGTSGATFYITGVQLEKGSTATSFDYRPYGTELQLCQRYYEVGSFVSMTTIGNPYPTIYYKVTKRASATVSNSRSLTVGIIDGVNGWYQNSNDSVASFCIFTSLAEL
jgi:hypothetical protein